VKTVSIKQSHELMAKLGTKVDWAAVPSDAAQRVVEDEEAGMKFCRFIENGGNMTCFMSLGIVAPKNGRVIIVTAVVDESRPWAEAVRAAGPDTGKDWDIWKVGDHYPAASGGTRRLTQVILANWKDGVADGTVPLVWSKKQRLLPATPRTVFAIGEQYPDLHRLMGVDPMAVVSLLECTFNGESRIPNVWWNGAQRDADRGRVARGWDGDAWFAFVRE